MAGRTHTNDSGTKKKRRAAATRAVGKGFFAALCLCLIAVGGMAVSTFSDTLRMANEPEPTYTTLAPTTTTSVAPAAAVTTPSTTTTVNTTVATTAKASALFVLPLSNRVVAPFSETPVYSQTMDDYRAHLGVDFDGEEGQAVRALADGSVTAVEEDALWGTSLTLAHGGEIVSIYRGVDTDVQVGDTVSVGDEIGFVATSPCEKAVGTHLHVELYRGDQAVDPATLLSGQLTTASEHE